MDLMQTHVIVGCISWKCLLPETLRSPAVVEIVSANFLLECCQFQYLTLTLCPRIHASLAVKHSRTYSNHTKKDANSVPPKGKNFEL
jgi:hypothetical protein